MFRMFPTDDMLIWFRAFGEIVINRMTEVQNRLM